MEVISEKITTNQTHDLIIKMQNYATVELLEDNTNRDFTVNSITVINFIKNIEKDILRYKKELSELGHSRRIYIRDMRCSLEAKVQTLQEILKSFLKILTTETRVFLENKKAELIKKKVNKLIDNECNASIARIKQ